MPLLSHARSAAVFNSGAVALVNPVNCDGVSNTGLSQEFERRYPDAHASYQKSCRTKQLKPGGLHAYHHDGGWVVHMAIKTGLRQKPKIEYVKQGLSELREFVVLNAITSISIPPLGCENGLSWPLVRREIEMAFNSLPSGTVELHLVEP